MLTRYLAPAEYGEVAMFQTILLVFSAIIGLQTAGAAGRKYFDDNLPEEEQRYFNGIWFIILCGSGSLVFLVVVIFKERLSSLVGLSDRYLVGAVVCAAANSVTQFCMYQWQVRNKAFHYGAMQFLQAALNAILSLILVVALLQGARGRIDAQIATSIIFAVLAWVHLQKDQLIGFAWRPHYAREALEFGVPLLPHSLGIVLLGALDRFVVNSLLGEGEVGVYMVAVQFALPVGILFASINNAYVPWLFERLNRDEFDVKQKIVRGTYVYFALALTLALAAFALGPFAIRLVAGERYSEASNIIGWTTLAQSFIGMYLMVTNYIFYSKKTGLLSLVSVASGLLNVILLYILTRNYGIAGTAGAMALAMGLRFLFTWVVAQLRHPMPWFKFRVAV